MKIVKGEVMSDERIRLLQNDCYAYREMNCKLQAENTILKARVEELGAEVKQQSERLAVYYDIERSLDAQIDELKDQLRLVKEASHE